MRTYSKEEFFSSVGYLNIIYLFDRMSVGEFKPPMMNTDVQPPPTKKKRRASNAMTAAAQPPPSPVMRDLLPPPLTGNGKLLRVFRCTITHDYNNYNRSELLVPKSKK